METLKSIEERRSIRQYTNRKLTKEIIEDLLNCGRLAPSAKNRQPWYFVIVQDDMKDKIADTMIDYAIHAVEVEKEKTQTYKSSVKSTANVIKQAPVLVLLFREKDNNWTIGDTLSIGACVENICLRATDLGIGSLWIRDTVHVSEDIANMVGHPDLELNCALTLGYANEFPKARPRKELENIIEWF